MSTEKLSALELEHRLANAENKIVKLEYKLNKAITALLFYAEPSNWDKPNNDWMLFCKIDNSDCADYPHITRDVRETGGARARKTINELQDSK